MPQMNGHEQLKLAAAAVFDVHWPRDQPLPPLLRELAIALMALFASRECGKAIKEFANELGAEIP